MGLEVRRGIILGRVRSVWERFLGCCHDLFLNLGLTTQVCSFYENSSGSKLMCIFLYVCNTSKESLKEKKRQWCAHKTLVQCPVHCKSSGRACLYVCGCPLPYFLVKFSLCCPHRQMSVFPKAGVLAHKTTGWELQADIWRITRPSSRKNRSQCEV